MGNKVQNIWLKQNGQCYNIYQSVKYNANNLVHNQINYDGYANEGNWNLKVLLITNYNKSMNIFIDEPLAILSLVAIKSNELKIYIYIINNEMKNSIKNLLLRREIKWF